MTSLSYVCYGTDLNGTMHFDCVGCGSDLNGLKSAENRLKRQNCTWRIIMDHHTQSSTARWKSILQRQQRRNWWKALSLLLILQLWSRRCRSSIPTYFASTTKLSTSSHKSPHTKAHDDFSDVETLRTPCILHQKQQQHDNRHHNHPQNDKNDTTARDATIIRWSNDTHALGTPQQQQPDSTAINRFHTRSFSCYKETKRRKTHHHHHHQQHVIVNFQIYECPPAYAASTFQVVAFTNQSRIMGRVQKRQQYWNGCGIYNVTVPAMASQEELFIDVFWTSHYSHYSNRISDIVQLQTIKNGDLTAVESFMSPERLDFSTRHLDRLHGFPLSFRIVHPPTNPQQDSRGSRTNAFLRKSSSFSNQQEQQQHLNGHDYDSSPLVPDCATVPLQEWKPVGVGTTCSFLPTSSHCHNNDNDDNTKIIGGQPQQQDDMTTPSSSSFWKFQSSHCQLYHERSLDDLTSKLRGWRINILGDSHGGNVMVGWRKLLCPERTDGEYFADAYDCPNRTNTFQVTYRFFRAVHSNAPQFTQDHDGLSTALRYNLISPNKNNRNGNANDKKEDAPQSPPPLTEGSICRSILGLGLYNATIMMIPAWLFVYETKEGLLENFVYSVQSMLENCQRLYPTQYANHVFLIQTPMATSSLPHPKNNISKTEFSRLAWRGIHNSHMEEFGNWVEQQLGGYLGQGHIIPNFDYTQAKLMDEGHTMDDGLHLKMEYYEEIAQIQATAVMSAMNNVLGQSPLPANHTPFQDLRWFEGLDLQ